MSRKFDNPSFKYLWNILIAGHVILRCSMLGLYYPDHSYSWDDFQWKTWPELWPKFRPVTPTDIQNVERRLMQTMDMTVVKKKRIALMERDAGRTKSRQVREDSANSGWWSRLRIMAASSGSESNRQSSLFISKLGLERTVSQLSSNFEEIVNSKFERIETNVVISLLDLTQLGLKTLSSVDAIPITSYGRIFCQEIDQIWNTSLNGIAGLAVTTLRLP